MIVEPVRAVERLKEIGKVKRRVASRGCVENEINRSGTDRIGAGAFRRVMVGQNEVPPPNLNSWTVSYFPLVSGIA